MAEAVDAELGGELAGGLRLGEPGAPFTPVTVQSASRARSTVSTGSEVNCRLPRPRPSLALL